MNSNNKSPKINLWDSIKEFLSKKEVKISILKRNITKKPTLYKGKNLSKRFFVGNSDEARNDSRFYFPEVEFDFLGEIMKEEEEYFFELKNSPRNKIFLRRSWGISRWFPRPISKNKKIKLTNSVMYFGEPKFNSTIELKFHSSTAFSQYLLMLVKFIVSLILLIIVLFVVQCFIAYLEVPISSDQEPLGSVTILDRNDSNILINPVSFLLKNKELMSSQYYVSTKDSGHYLTNAIIASEDRAFRYNPLGSDIPAVVSAIINSVIKGIPIKEGRGASTIYQQVASSSGIIPNIRKTDISWDRKFREVVAAFKLINTFGSEKVLEIYINTIHFGNGNDGVQSASYFYFGKSVADLTLSEAAIVVGAIQEPCAYDLEEKLIKDDSIEKKEEEIIQCKDLEEYENLTRELVIEKMEKRRSTILNTMVESKFVKKEDAEKADKEPINLVGKFSEDLVLPYYIQEKINDLIIKESGAEKHLIFQLGTDGDIQKKSDKALVDAVSKYGNLYNFNQGAIVTLDTRDGSVLAITGGINSVYNRATEAQRAPGSIFKIFTFLAALENGISPNKGFECSQTEGIAGCQRSGASRSISMIDGFIRSENVVAVRIARQVGFENIIRLARKLGITTNLDESSNMVLGGEPAIVLEMASAYAAIVNDGVYSKPVSIINFKKCKEDKNTCSTAFDYTKEKIQSNPVIDPANARIMLDMMRGVVEFGGTGVDADIVDEYVVGKTGTTDQSRDLWFIGALPEKHLLAAIWLGNDEGTTNGSSSIAAQIWNDYVTEVLRKTS